MVGANAHLHAHAHVPAHGSVLVPRPFARDLVDSDCLPGCM